MDPSDSAETGYNMSAKKETKAAPMPRQGSKAAQTQPLPFPLEALNRGRPISNRPIDVMFSENWSAVPGARAAECSREPTVFHELQPRNGGRLIQVPGSHIGGEALADACRGHLTNFLWVVVNDERWATARSHKSVHTLAESAFITHALLQSMLKAFVLANKGPRLSAEETQQLDLAIENAEDLIKLVKESNKFEAMIAGLDKANQVRTENKQALEEIVAELDREHPYWSNVQMAEELRVKGIIRSPRRVGQIRNKQKEVLRKFGR